MKLLKPSFLVSKTPCFGTVFTKDDAETLKLFYNDDPGVILQHSGSKIQKKRLHLSREDRCASQQAERRFVVFLHIFQTIR